MKLQFKICLNAINKRSKTMKILDLNGLRNIGDTYFMNSVNQCLPNTRWLLEFLVKDINNNISNMKGAH